MKLRWLGHGSIFVLPFFPAQQKGSTNTQRKAGAASIGSCLLESLNMYIPVAAQFASTDNKKNTAPILHHLHSGNKSKVCCLNPFMMLTG